MYTSAIDKKTLIKGGFVQLGAAAFCVLFNYVYSIFSYGEYSKYMQLMFMWPLLMGALPLIVLGISGLAKYTGRWAFNFWNSAVAVLTAGCLFKGIVEISGRFTDYDMYYWIAGAAFAVLALAAAIVHSLRAGDEDGGSDDTAHYGGFRRTLDGEPHDAADVRRDRRGDSAEEGYTRGDDSARAYRAPYARRDMAEEQIRSEGRAERPERRGVAESRDYLQAVKAEGEAHVAHYDAYMPRNRIIADDDEVDAGHGKQAYI